MTAQRPTGDHHKARTGRSFRSTIGVLALGLPAALGLAACGSSNGASNTTVPPSTALRSHHASTDRAADRLCTEVSTVVTGFKHLNLSSPSTAMAGAGKLSTEFNKLAKTLGTISRSHEQNLGSAQPLVTKTKAGVKAAEAAFGQFEKGKTATAHSDFNVARSDFMSAKAAGARAHIRGCSS